MSSKPLRSLPVSSSPASGLLKVAESATWSGHFRPFSPAGLGFAWMRGLQRTPWIYDGRLPNRHIWRHLLLAASTARTSTGAREVMASAGCGKSCCLLRWRQVTDVSTGRHLRSDRSATIAPLPLGGSPWSDACGNTLIFIRRITTIFFSWVGVCELKII